MTALDGLLATEPLDLARAMLVVARLEYPGLDPGPSLATLDRLGTQAADRLTRLPDPSARARVAALNALLFQDEGFAGDRAHYGDFRNSLLNDVLTRRLGIPITLALVYIEVARRAGFAVQGVGFPGHFLLRVPGGGDPDAGGDEQALILDPFNGGAELTDEDCRRLFAEHVGPIHEDLPFDSVLLNPCTPRHMLARMLNNLKRTYIELRSFPQARAVTDLLLAVDPTLISEIRDRGLLAYHLDDFPAALRDLEDYRRLNGWTEGSGTDERDQVWEHIKALKRRVAGMN